MKLGLVLLVAVAGCVSAATITAEQTAVAAYGAEQIQCVELAATRGQADECRARVRATYCGPGGVLAEAGACDGGQYLTAPEPGPLPEGGAQ